MAQITQIWHVAANNLTPEQFERVKKICFAHGGIYCSALSRSGYKLPAGYVFQSAAKAEAAAQEIDHEQERERLLPG